MIGNVSLRTRIAIIALISVLSLSAVLVAVGELKARLQASRFAAEQLATDADLFGTIRDLDLAVLRGAAASLASDPLTDDALALNVGTDPLAVLLTDTRDRLDLPASIFLLDADGAQIARSGRLTPVAGAFTLVLDRASERDRPETIARLENGALALVVADEVRRGDRVIGYVVVASDLGARLRAFFRSAQAVVLLSQDTAVPISGSAGTWTALLEAECCVGEARAISTGNLAGRVFVTFLPLFDAQGRLVGDLAAIRDVTSRSRSELLVNGMATVMVILGVLFSVGFLLRAVRLSFRPLGAVIRVLEDMMRGDLSVRLRPVQATREIEALVETVEQLRAGEQARSRLLTLNSQLAAARNIQQSLLPDPVYETPGLDAYGSMVPAEEVAGDFFDIFEVSGGSVCMIIGDVAGKGIAAAMFAARASEVMRTIANRGGDPAAIIEAANNELSRRNPEGLFISVFLAIVTPATGGVVYVNAGHCPPFRTGVDGKVTAFEPEGNIVLGILPDAPYTAGQFELEVGERLLIFSDGFDESQDDVGAFLGEDGALAVYAETVGQSPKDTVDSIMAAIAKFGNGAAQFDDITLLAFERKPITDSAEHADTGPRNESVANAQ